MIHTVGEFRMRHQMHKNVFLLFVCWQMEDEGSYGNDDIRCFILSNLATAKMSKTFCVVCQNAMQIYDRYPLIDGTFFLSPKQYSKACIPVSLILISFTELCSQCDLEMVCIIDSCRHAAYGAAGLCVAGPRSQLFCKSAFNRLESCACDIFLCRWKEISFWISGETFLH